MKSNAKEVKEESNEDSNGTSELEMPWEAQLHGYKQVYEPLCVKVDILGFSLHRLSVFLA